MIPQFAALLMAFLSALSLGVDTLAAELAPEGYLMLVSRAYPLSSAYVPADLVYPDVKLNNTRDKAAARLLVADPGCSEHQLGLAMDIKGSKDGLLNSAFGKTPAGIWLAENAWRFGFIIRYKEEWTDITTYAYEPWHVRYVGKKHAAILQELDIPLEQYVEALRSLAADSLPEGE